MTQILDIPTWIQILSALLVPLIAFVTTTIIILQYKLAKQRWRLDLYDKRYAAYWTTIEYLSNIVTKKQLTYEEFKALRTKFLRNSKDKEFLFGEDVQQFLHLLYERSSDLGIILYALNYDEKNENNVNEKKKLVSWFSEQLEVPSVLFRNYLMVERSWMREQFKKIMALIKRITTAI